MKEKKSPGRHDATSLHHRRSPCVLCISVSRCSMSGGATESPPCPLFARPLACLARYPLLLRSLSVSGFVPLLPDRDRTIWNIFLGKFSAMLKCHPFNSVLCLPSVWSGSWDMDLLSISQLTVQPQCQIHDRLVWVIGLSNSRFGRPREGLLIVVFHGCGGSNWMLGYLVLVNAGENFHRNEDKQDYSICRVV